MLKDLLRRLNFYRLRRRVSFLLFCKTQNLSNYNDLSANYELLFLPWFDTRVYGVQILLIRCCLTELICFLLLVDGRGRTRGGFLNLKSKLHLDFTNVPLAVH